MAEIGNHGVVLRGTRVLLRPFAGADLPRARGWWNDKKMSYYSDDNPPHDYSPDEIAGIYATLSRDALVFVIEHEGKPVGDCWLQRMNIERVIGEFPGKDIRRIDIQIEPAFWGKGLGTEAIGLLAGLAFGREGAGILFEAEIGNHNPRSLKAFARCGFTVHAERGPWHDGRASLSYDLILTRERWEGMRETAR